MKRNLAIFALFFLAAHLLPTPFSFAENKEQRNILRGYQERDWKIVDYHAYDLEGIRLQFRGPKPRHLEKGKYIVCVGASQTFGCFCEKPYPALLQERFALTILNLGARGAGPSFFLQHKKLLEYINNAKFVIIQVMSGRSTNNSLFYTIGGRGATLIRLSDGAKIRSSPAYQELLQTRTKDYVKKIVAETRQNWVNDIKSFWEKLRCQKFFFGSQKENRNIKKDILTSAHCWESFLN